MMQLVRKVGTVGGLMFCIKQRYKPIQPRQKDGHDRAAQREEHWYGHMILIGLGLVTLDVLRRVAGLGGKSL